MTGFGGDFRHSIDKCYKYDRASSKIVKVGKTAAGGK